MLESSCSDHLFPKKSTHSLLREARTRRDSPYMADESPSTSSPREPEPVPIHWFKRLRRHVIFPILVFVVASRLIGEFYPISPFSMYSNPTTRPLSYFYVADDQGKPLPIQTHTGVSPASITKKFGRHKGDLEDDVEDGKRELTEDEIFDEAGTEILYYLRDLSFNRKALPQGLQFVEVSISFAEEGGLLETPRVVAEIPPHEGPIPEKKKK